MATREALLEERAHDAVTAVLNSLRNEDAAAYHGLLSQEDQEFVSVEDVAEGIAEMRQKFGPLLTYDIHGVTVRERAKYAGAHVGLHFARHGDANEVYSLILEDDTWRLTVGLAPHP